MSEGDSLFGEAIQRTSPLAERVRPDRLEDVAGHDGLLAEGTLLGDALRSGAVPSLVLWGPPGTGKTTLARLLARRSEMTFVALSAVTSGVKDVRAVIQDAKGRRRTGRRTLLFVDEIHRFNKAQQDAFLPHIEDGTVTLVGATTENPGFALIGALLSRVRIVVLEALSEEGLERILDRALAHPSARWAQVPTLEADARDALLAAAGGDARRMLNVFDSAVSLAETRSDGASAPVVTLRHIREAAGVRRVRHDRSGDDRYDLLSALHKSLRGSDPDAALYYAARLIEAGDDPHVILRRVVAMASEDIGMADPQALVVAMAAVDAVQFMGQPEGELALAQAIVHCATAPKSNATVLAWKAAKAAAAAGPDVSIPIHVRNAPTRVAKDLGHGKGYEYPHDKPGAFSAQPYLPPELEGTTFYTPKASGHEREIEKRLAWWRARRDERG